MLRGFEKRRIDRQENQLHQEDEAEVRKKGPPHGANRNEHSVVAKKGPEGIFSIQRVIVRLLEAAQHHRTRRGRCGEPKKEPQPVFLSDAPKEEVMMIELRHAAIADGAVLRAQRRQNAANGAIGTEIPGRRTTSIIHGCSGAQVTLPVAQGRERDSVRWSRSLREPARIGRRKETKHQDLHNQHDHGPHVIKRRPYAGREKKHGAAQK